MNSSLLTSHQRHVTSRVFPTTASVLFASYLRPCFSHQSLRVMAHFGAVPRRMQPNPTPRQQEQQQQQEEEKKRGKEDADERYEAKQAGDVKAIQDLWRLALTFRVIDQRTYDHTMPPWISNASTVQAMRDVTAFRRQGNIIFADRWATRGPEAEHKASSLFKMLKPDERAEHEAALESIRHVLRKAFGGTGAVLYKRGSQASGTALHEDSDLDLDWEIPKPTQKEFCDMSGRMCTHAPDYFCHLVRCLALVLVRQLPDTIKLAKRLLDITRSIPLVVHVQHANATKAVPVDLFPKLCGGGKLWSVSHSTMTSGLLRDWINTPIYSELEALTQPQLAAVLILKRCIREAQRPELRDIKRYHILAAVRMVMEGDEEEKEAEMQASLKPGQPGFHRAAQYYMWHALELLAHAYSMRTAMHYSEQLSEQHEEQLWQLRKDIFNKDGRNYKHQGQQLVEAVQALMNVVGKPEERKEVVGKPAKSKRPRRE